MKNLDYAYLGPPGTFSEQAISAYCNSYGGKTHACDSIRDIVETIVKDEFDLGLLPLENSLEGSVNLSLDLLYKHSELKLYREIVLPIAHYLLAAPGVKKDDIKKIYSHPQAIAQSGDYINQHLSEAKIVYTDSTAAAAAEALKHDDRAVIGSIRLADIYQLNILAENLQGDLPNATRFVLAARADKDFSDKKHLGNNADSQFKTSIICAPEVNRAGVLHEILGEFAKKEIDLSRIESRPTRQRLGEYLFYIDLMGCSEDPELKEALDEVEAMSGYFRLLGSYPKTVIE